MSLVKWTFIALIGLPAAEVLGFVLVAGLIGWLRAGVALVATSILGILLLRHSGRRDFARLVEGLRRNGMAALRLDSPAAATMLGTMLLILPGFITGLAGAALFVPALRRWAATRLAHGTRSRAGPHEQTARDRVIDLEPGEWHRISDRSRPRPRRQGRSKAKDGAKT
jgi:UPF0716 protein FxsA